VVEGAVDGLLLAIVEGAGGLPGAVADGVGILDAQADAEVAGRGGVHASEGRDAAPREAAKERGGDAGRDQPRAEVAAQEGQKTLAERPLGAG